MLFINKKNYYQKIEINLFKKENKDIDYNQNKLKIDQN